MEPPRITYDAHGTPGVWASSLAQAYYGFGWLHGRHRPLQTLLLSAAARGELSACLLARPDLQAADALIHRLDIPAHAAREAEEMDLETASFVDAYLAGVRRGLRSGGRPLELRALLTRLPLPDRATVLAGMMLGAYLGHAQSQERMERALVEVVADGADVGLLEQMFEPHLEGWVPHRLRKLPRQPVPGFAAAPFMVGGSNAWAVSPARSRSGRAILCGDPHMQINQLPAFWFEVRARVGDDLWLGATIPGLPGLAIGRTRQLSWCGTYSVADTVDLTIEVLESGQVLRERGPVEIRRREVEIRRRFKSPVRLRFFDTDRGTLERSALDDGDALAVRWSAPERAAQALSAYLHLPLAQSAADAERTLEHAHTLSLHFVLADNSGDVRYCQVGRVPKRTAMWSGLHPVSALGLCEWEAYYEGKALPRALGTDGMVASANEARLGIDGATLSTLAQPEYRLQRIRQRLGERNDHDFDSMRALQLDLRSPQAARLLPHLRAALPPGPVLAALDEWDLCYDADSRGAHAFELAYGAARRALADELGGELMRTLLAESELPVWWAAAFDRVLGDGAHWEGERGGRLAEGLAAIAASEPARWGEVQTFSLNNVVLGGLPRVFGFDRGPYPLPGSLATVNAGNVVHYDGAELAIGPAYRMVCDFADDGLWTSLPGGIDGSRFDSTYARWVDAWRAGEYHRLEAPHPSERSIGVAA